jgi:Ca2+-binding EF-hand superfamily protein
MAATFRVRALLVAGLVAAGTCVAQSIPATATERFDALDTNHDGLVSKAEYDSNALFKAIDSDRNYRITAGELEAILGPQEDGMQSAADRIRVADRNEDGELNDEELRRAGEMRFDWLDSNRDGTLDLAEMKSGFGIPAQRP